MFSSKHAKFHAFITKVNNSALFWPLAARLLHDGNIQCVPKKGYPLKSSANPNVRIRML